MPRDEFGVFRGALPGHRADADCPLVKTDFRQPRHPAQIDKRRGRKQAEIEHRDQALPAGQHARRALVALEQLNRLVQLLRRVVIEFRGFQAAAPRSVPFYV